MRTILIIVVLILLFGGGVGAPYAYRTYGGPALGGVLGVLLVVLLIVWILGSGVMYQ